MTNDRLSEVRDLIVTNTNENKQLRQEQLELLPAARTAGATTTELASRFGISRAAFYKNGYAKIGAGKEGAPAQLPELLERISELAVALTASEEQLAGLRRERDQAIRDEIGKAEDTWVRIAQRAGVSEEWLNRLRSQS